MAENNNLYTNLAALGLRDEESAVYLLLLTKGSLTAKAIAASQDIIVNSVYRIVRSLISKGLIVALDTSPRQFQAVSPSSGITKLADSSAAKLHHISRALLEQLPAQENPHHLTMELLTSRKMLFEQFVSFAKGARQEILVISIGEPVPEAIWSVTATAIAKGIKPKYIFHKYDKDNILLIKRWLTMGVAVRHLPGAGYHLNIIDTTVAILSASNPTQSRERSGVVIYNQAIIEVLRDYFFQQWQLAGPL
jgi:sugar-specific transcriptional regulator TrmB